MTVRQLGTVPADEDGQRIYLSHEFGRLFFDMARAPALARVSALPESVRPDVEAILDSALYAVTQLLDGVTDSIRSEHLQLEFALIARLRESDTGEPVMEVELAPMGEGLCIGYHSWVDGDFGATPSP